MKNTTLLILLSLFIISCGDETIDFKKIVERNDLFYKVNSQKPYSGNWTVFYEKGQIKGKGNFRDGKGNGKWTVYHENGQVWEEGNLKDSNRNGKWTVYYENGQVREEGNFQDEQLVGKWTYYNKDGSIEKINTYYNSTCVVSSFDKEEY